MMNKMISYKLLKDCKCRLLKFGFHFRECYTSATLSYCFDCQDLPFRRKTVVWNFKAGEFHSRLSTTKFESDSSWPLL